MPFAKYVTSIAGNDVARAMLVGSDGRIYLVGESKATLSSPALLTVVAYHSDGTLDTSFSSDGVLTTVFPGLSDSRGVGMALQSNGALLVVGSGFNAGIGFNDLTVARYLPDGTLDNSFGGGDGLLSLSIGRRSDAAYSVALQSDGKILVGGVAYDRNDNGDFSLIRLLSDGTLDSTFGTAGVTLTGFGQDDVIRKVVVQADGKILVVGTTKDINSAADIAVARYNTDGSLDTGFANQGRLTLDLSVGEAITNDIATGLALQGDKIVISAYAEGNSGYASAALIRLASSGQLDSSFAGGGKVLTNISGAYDTGWDVHVLDEADGKIVMTGSVNGDMALYQFNADGSPDVTTGAQGVSTVDFPSNTDNASDLGYAVGVVDGNLAIAGAGWNGTDYDFGLAILQGNHLPQGGVTVGGLVAQGQLLSAVTSSLSDAEGLGVLAYQWQANGASINGAIASTYRLTQTDVGKALSVVVSYTDGLGTPERVVSAPTAAVANVDDAATGSLTVTGSATEGGSLRAQLTSVSDLDGATTTTYRWQQKLDSVWTDVSGASGSTLNFLSDQSDVGKVLRVVATTTDALGGTTQFIGNEYTVANVDDVATGTLTVSGTAAEGSSLTASLANVVDPDGATNTVYRWQQLESNVWSAISGVYGATLNIPSDQSYVGKVVRAMATSTDALGGSTVFYGSQQTVVNVNDLPTGNVTISGAARQGQTLTAANSLADADGLGTVTYTWKSGATVLGTGSSLLLGQTHVGQAITVTASYTDGFNAPESKVSAATVAVANVNDAPTGSVTISGTAEQGRTLTASNTLADADGLGPVTYTWKSGAAVLGTGSSLLLDQTHVGQAITVTASYSDLQGTVEAVSSTATLAVANVNDAPTGLVTISGAAEQGRTLTAGNTLVDADGLGPMTYTWKSGAMVLGTGSSLLLGQTHVGQAITVTASYVDGFNAPESQVSAATVAVSNVNDAPTGAVTIGGTAQQGRTLTASNTLADADGLGTVTYTWKSGATVLGTGSSLLLGQTHVGQNITVTASYTDGFNAPESQVSAATVAVANVNDAPTGAVTISGAAEQGQTLTASNTLVDTDGLGPVTYTWKSGATMLGTGGSLVLGQANVGQAITVTASYIDGFNMPESKVSAATVAVANVNDAPSGSVTIGGTAEQGRTLTASNTLVDADGLGPVTYTWKSGATVLGTGSSLLLGQTHVGQAITVTASYVDGFNASESQVSAATVAVVNVNDAPSGSVTISGTPEQGRTLTAGNTLVDADGLGPVTYTWKSGATVLGTGSSLLLDQTHVGQAITVTASYSDLQGTVEAVSSTATLAVANVNDAPTGLVTISGAAEQGRTLTAGNTLVDADGLGPMTYTWKSGAMVLGTGSSLLLGQTHVGQAITVTASYVDGFNAPESQVSAATVAVSNVNDAPTGTVTISGTAQQGRTLMASNTLVDADGLGPVTYTWKTGETVLGSGGSLLLGQTHVGQTITVTASYTDLQGTVESVSSTATLAVANVNDAPTGTVTISGTAEQGQTLTATNSLADTDGLDTIIYTWKSGAAVLGTGSSLLLGQTHVGQAITVTASYVDGFNTPESLISSATVAVANVNDAPTGTVTISGTVQQGRTLTAAHTLADVDGLGAISYTWKAGETVLGTGSSLVLGQAHVGQTITVTASYVDGFGAAESLVSSATLAVVNANDAPTGTVTINGTAEQGRTLTAGNTLADVDGLGAISYTWKAGETVLGTGGSLVLGQTHVGQVITVTASYVDGFNTPESLISSATVAVANVNDAPTGSVTISGTAQQGRTLTAAHTLADVDGLGAISYTWKAGETVLGTGASLLLGQTHVGQAITVTASYTDEEGTQEAVRSSASGVVANVNDVPTGTVVVSGTLSQGQTVTAKNNLADVDGLGILHYQWLDDQTPLGGEIGSQLILTESLVGHRIRVVISYVDSWGTAESVSSALSSGITNVNEAPLGTVQIQGQVQQGQILSALVDIRDGDGLGEFSYQWYAGDSLLDVDASLLSLTQALVGQSISLVVNYVDGQGTMEGLISSATVAVANVNDAPTGSVTISGTAQQGRTLTAAHTLDDVDGLGAISYTWKAGETVLGTGSSLVLGQAHVGQTITVTASYVDGFGAAESLVSSATLAVVNANDAPTGTVTISGTAEQGRTLTAGNTLADVDGLGAISYTWKAGETVLGTGGSLVLGQANLGQVITVTASYTDGFNALESQVSAATVAVANVNDAPTGTVTISGTAQQGRTLTAAHTLADADGLGAISYTWMAGETVLGTGSSLVLGQTHVGQAITVTASYTDGFNTPESKVSAVTVAVVNVNDAPTGSVTIGGTAEQGRTLTAGNTLADVDGLGAISYTWKAGETVLGTGGSLVLGQTHVGQVITVTASYVDGFNTPESLISSATVAVANVNDAPTGSVTISGTAQQGRTLTAAHTLADVDGLGAISYTWKAGETVLGTGASLLLGQTHVGQAITVTASYTDGYGEVESQVGVATEAVANANDAPTGTVTISGTAQQGRTLTAVNNVADVDGLGPVTYTWKSGAVTLGTGSSLLLGQSQVGQAITVTASYVDGFNTAESLISSATVAVANVNDAPTGTVTIGGTAEQGRTLTASNTLADADGLGAISYTWMAGETVLGTGASLLLGQTHVGQAITVMASYTDGFNAPESQVSAATVAVSNVNDAPTGAVTISGKPQQGQTLTAAHTLADADGLDTISYTWKTGEITWGTGSSLALDQSHVGQQITVTASYTDWQGTAEAVNSAATVAVASANSEPIAGDTPVLAIEDTLWSGRFLAVDSDGDALNYRIVQGPEHGAVSLSSDGRFLYRPASNFNGLDSFQYVASDGLLESNEATVSLNVQAVNDAPLGTGKTWTINEDNSLVLSPEVFGFRDVDAGDSLQAVRFTIIASKGNILLNGEAVSVGQEIAVSELQAGHLVYTPLANGYGAPYVNLRFQVSDGQDFSRASYMLSVKVNPVRDDLVLHGTDGNDTINGDLIDKGSLDQLYGLAGNDRLIGRYARDTIVGGTGADTIYGGDGSDILKFAAGDSGQATGFDVVADYQMGARSTGDLIDYAKSMTIGGSAAVATSTQASINASTGVATFASGSGTTMADALADVAARMTAASDAAGEMAFFQVSKKGHTMLFISDGVAGVTANDVVVQLMGISAINQIDLTGGNLTILG